MDHSQLPVMYKIRSVIILKFDTNVKWGLLYDEMTHPLAPSLPSAKRGEFDELN